MSHDDRTTPSDGVQGPALARWLDHAPGTAPPADLDREVVEAVYAIRPDLAPRPRLSADDILASLTSGPLAGPVAGTAAAPAAEAGGEVVPFPARRAPAELAESAAPAPRRSGWASWARSTGGLGLALVAAATFLLVAVPQLREQAPPADGPLPASATAPATSAPAAAGIVADTPVAQEPAPPAQVVGARSEVAATRAAPAADDAYDMKPMASVRGRETIAEVAAGLDEADAEGPEEQVDAGVAAPVDGLASAPAAEPPVDLDSVRERVASPPPPPSAWRQGVDGDTLARIDRAVETANRDRARGDYRGAGDTLAAAVGPPPRAGMYVAGLAAQDYLRAGVPDAAAGVAQRGLGLSSEDLPERAFLLLLYGDAMRAQEQPREALDAYEQAGEVEVGR